MNVNSLGDCCNEFYADCQTYQLVYPKLGSNKCHFGMATTTSGGITPSAAPWTVYIKEGTICWHNNFQIKMSWFQNLPLQAIRVFLSPELFLEQIWYQVIGMNMCTGCIQLPTAMSTSTPARPCAPLTRMTPAQGMRLRLLIFFKT